MLSLEALRNSVKKKNRKPNLKLPNISNKLNLHKYSNVLPAIYISSFLIPIN
jgi:hypothetical protein